MIVPGKLVRAATVTALLLTAACSGASGDDAKGGADSKGGAAGPGGGGGRGGAVTLSQSDIAPARRLTMEEATPVTGDLRPVETVEVRARLEGDLAGVYAREGQPVRAGEVLARFEDSQQSSSLRSAQAAVASARVDLSTAEWNLTQTRELFRQGAVAEQVLKTAEQGSAAAAAHMAAAQAELRAASQVQTDTRVVAPVTGIVEKREAENGEHIARGTLMFTVVRNEVLELTAAVPARLANGIVPGQTVHFDVEGKPRNGKVARVSPTIDPLSRSVTVYAQVPNPGGAIKGGTFATGRVVRRVLQDALTVPSAAVRQRPITGSPFVYKLANDRVAESDITLGAADEALQLVEVLSGVQDGDRVIVGNVGMLGKGMRVQVLGGEAGGPGGGRRGMRPGRPGAADGPSAAPPAGVPAEPAATTSPARSRPGAGRPGPGGTTSSSTIQR